MLWPTWDPSVRMLTGWPRSTLSRTMFNGNALMFLRKTDEKCRFHASFLCFLCFNGDKNEIMGERTGENTPVSWNNEDRLINGLPLDIPSITVMGRSTGQSENLGRAKTFFFYAIYWGTWWLTNIDSPSFFLGYLEIPHVHTSLWEISPCPNLAYFKSGTSWKIIQLILAI